MFSARAWYLLGVVTLSYSDSLSRFTLEIFATLPCDTALACHLCIFNYKNSTPSGAVGLYTPACLSQVHGSLVALWTAASLPGFAKIAMTMEIWSASVTLAVIRLISTLFVELMGLSTGRPASWIWRLVKFNCLFTRRSHWRNAIVSDTNNRASVSFSPTFLAAFQLDYKSAAMAQILSNRIWANLLIPQSPYHCVTNTQ